MVYLDKLDHASIVDGAKLSYGETERFNHGDLANLERRLERNGGTRGSMIVVDGVYSMEGNIADVPALVRIARKYGAALALDDAHALGVLGPNGDGTAAHFGMTDEVDIIAGTFSKSLASIGGFVAGSESVIHYLKHHSRPLIFTASLPPANTAGVLAALQVLQSEPRAARPALGQHPPPACRLPGAGLRHRADRDADRSRARRSAGEDLPHVAPAVRRRGVHQPGRAARGAAVAVPAPHEPHGHAHLRADRFRGRAVRPHRAGPGGNLTAPPPPRVRAARDRRDVKRFLDLPYRLHARDPLWVPPLRRDVELLLSRTKNPFFEHGEAEYFLAERDGEVVGRIAAISNRLHNETHADHVGFFGFFESVDDQAVADALLARGRERGAASAGHDVLRGPASFSVNDECGLLVDGFDTPPTLMMPHNPRYYIPLLERAGFVTAKNLLVYQGGSEEKYVPGAGAPGARHRADPPADGDHHPAAEHEGFHGEVERIKELYNAAWEKNWGFVPMTDHEIDHLAEQFKPVVIPEHGAHGREGRQGDRIRHRPARPQRDLPHQPAGAGSSR